MTEREIAERLRKAADHSASIDRVVAELKAIADELDPHRPEPGTVVWWQDDEGLGDPVLGQVNDIGVIMLFGTRETVRMESVKWWPARIAGPMQDIVDIPPTNIWGYIGELHIKVYAPQADVVFSDVIITRDEAARRETER